MCRTSGRSQVPSGPVRPTTSPWRVARKVTRRRQLVRTRRDGAAERPGERRDRGGGRPAPATLSPSMGGFPRLPTPRSRPRWGTRRRAIRVPRWHRPARRGATRRARWGSRGKARWFRVRPMASRTAGPNPGPPRVPCARPAQFRCARVGARHACHEVNQRPAGHEGWLPGRPLWFSGCRSAQTLRWRRCCSCRRRRDR
jgi:hypothetical protein